MNYALCIVFCITLTLTSCGGDVGSGGDSDGVRIMAAGSQHTVAIKNDGTLWAWEFNQEGQLGNGKSGTGFKETIPVKVITVIDSVGMIDTDWASVAAGSVHTVAIKTTGTLWSWGQRQWGLLGDGIMSPGNQLTPKQVGLESNWKSVSTGQFHTIAQTTDYTIYTWGNNEKGKLGTGDINHRATPVSIGDAADLMAVSAGRDHTTALRKSGILWTWGDNVQGQLGRDTSIVDSEKKPDPVEWK